MSWPFSPSAKSSEPLGSGPAAAPEPASTSTSGPASTSAPAGTAKRRRVTEGERRRTEISCDRCKKRKIRCIRPARIEGSEDDPACDACAEAGAECEAKLPRRQRLYASMEQLSVRYRVLDQVLRATFPEYDLDSTAGVLALAAEKGVEVPRVPREGEGEGEGDGAGYGAGAGSAGRRSGQGTGTGEVVPLDASTDSDLFFDLPTKGLLPPELRPYLSSHTIAQPVTADHSTFSGIFRIPEGSLVPAPRGGFHYVGPASLAYFAKIARELVTKCNQMLPTFDEAGLRRFLKAAEFTTFKTSQAIEARVEGHPVMVAEQEAEAATTAPATIVGLSPATPAPQRRMLEHVPDRKLADRLVYAYFDRVHPNFPIFHQGAFLMRYESIWAHNHEPESGWVSALLMVLVFGAQALETESDAMAPIQQRLLAAFIRDGLPRLCLTASLGNVQALMLLSLYQHNAGERNAAWMLLGQAARTAVALGMHRDGQMSNFDPFERNTRRVVWWTLHSFEQSLSFALGRPGNTDLIDVSAVLPDSVFLDSADPPGYFERSIALVEISSRIRRFVASITPDYVDPARLESSCAVAQHLVAQLVAWRNDLPPHLSGSLSTRYPFATPRHQRAITLLHAQCDHYLSIVGRPYLLCRVNRDIEHEAARRTADEQQHTGARPTTPLPPAVLSLAQTSVEAGEAVVRSLLSLSAASLLEGTVWLDYYYIHHAAFILGLHFLGKPLDASDKDVESRTAISSLLAIAQRSRLAPTYRILMNVALQLAYIVGIGPESEDGWDAGWEPPLPALPALIEQQPQPQQTTLSQFAVGVGIAVPAGPSSARQAHTSSMPPPPPPPPLQQPMPPHTLWHPQSQSQSQPQSHSHSQMHSLFGTDTTQTLEQLFGPMPPSRHNSPPDVFSDLYSFGLDTTNENPWDFFQIGTTAEGLLNGLRNLEGQGSGLGDGHGFAGPM